MMEIDANKNTKIINDVASQTNLPRKKEAVKVEKKQPQLTQEQIQDLIHKEIEGLETSEIQSMLDNIASSSEILNKRVKLRVNKEINRVVITIVDKSTNEVIKQIPSEELQNLARHLNEAIGVLFDREV
jgi:flagellar protein FlaG